MVGIIWWGKAQWKSCRLADELSLLIPYCGFCIKCLCSGKGKGSGLGNVALRVHHVVRQLNQLWVSGLLLSAMKLKL